MSFWAWIPILTKQIQYEFFIKKIEEDSLIAVSESEKKTIRYILKTYILKSIDFQEDFDYYRRQDFDDVTNKIYKAILCVKDYKIKHIFIYDSKGKIQTIANCSICDNGLVKIDLNSDIVQISSNIQPIVAKRIYILIRDVYHSHTHHEKNGDSHLLLVFSDNKKYAIEKLLNQYDAKIINYHKTIKNDVEDVEDHKGFSAAIKLITSAKGEMNYALHFITLMKDDVDDFESYESSFLINVQSISILADELKLKFNNRVSEYNLNVSKFLNNLTLIIIVGTIPVTLVSVNELLKVIGFNETIVYNINYINNIKLPITLPILIAIFYFIFIMYIIYRLKYGSLVDIKYLKIIKFIKKHTLKYNKNLN